ncbi:hypothetical protein GCM10010104_33610 [Streptomyces indiaensis]|uniref:Uncharacterized protein n=1 Tax=Streptomyces indiaensis TaxID=284033 RepID=A0ABN3DM16_9ACTN
MGNTAVWTDCKGNGSHSWVKLKYVCWTPWGENYHETPWVPVGPTERTKISEECTFEALDAYSTSRAR